MSREILSTSRPTRLRLAGFLCIAAGALAAGVGATREWAAIGFPADLERAADVSVRGTDVWERKALLLGALVALCAMLAMRLAGRSSTRVWLAGLVVALGLATAILPLLDAARAEDRFGGVQGVDRLAEHIAAAVGQPEDVVRAQLELQLARDLRVDVGPGPWIAAAGGLLLVLGGALGLVWTRRTPAPAGPERPGGGE